MCAMEPSPAAAQAAFVPTTIDTMYGLTCVTADVTPIATAALES